MASMSRVETLSRPEPAGALARRLSRFEPSMLLWLAMIAVLVFLVASPMVRLVVSSFQDAETGRLTLANYSEAYGNLRQRRPDHQVSGSDRAVRRPGSDRAAGPLPRGLDPAVAILRISGAGRGGGRLFDPAAADHCPDVLAAALAGRPQGFCRGHRQGRRAAPDPARPMALADALLCAVRRLAVGAAADAGAAAGGFRQGLGQGLLAR